MSEDAVERLEAMQREILLRVRSAVELPEGTTDAELWQAGVRVGERHGAGMPLRCPELVAAEVRRGREN